MNLIKCFSLILMAVYVDADCTKGVLKCLHDYMEKVFAHAAMPDVLCKDIDVYMQCVFSQGCPISSAQKQQIIDQSEGPMAVLHCPFTISDLVNRYGSPQTVVTIKDSVNSAAPASGITANLIMTTSFVLLVLHLYFNY